MEKDEMMRRNAAAGEAAHSDGTVKKEGQQTTESDPDAKYQNNFERLLRSCCIPEGKAHDHKREQIYLMEQMNRSDRFVLHFVRDAPQLESMQIDIIRAASWFVDEEVLLQKINVKEVTVRAISKIIAESLAEARLEQKKEVEKTTTYKSDRSEGEKSRKENIVMESNSSGSERMEAYYRWMIEMTQKMHEQEMERISTQHQETVMQHRVRERMLEEENFRLSEEADALRKEQKHGIPLLGRGRVSRKERERDAFVNEVLSNPAFTTGQMEIIQRVVVSALPLEQIRNICRPELPVTNMLLLEKYYQKRNTEGR